MHDMDMMMDKICTEIEKIGEKGINTANLESAYKLIDMYYKLKKSEMYGGASHTYSERHRDSMGRYARNERRPYMDESYDRYMDSKNSYRYSGGNKECKERMMQTLDEYMADYTRQLEELARDADCVDEKEVINKYIKRINDIRR